MAPSLRKAARGPVPRRPRPRDQVGLVKAARVGTYVKFMEMFASESFGLKAKK